MARLQAVLIWPLVGLAGLRGSLFPWVPVCIGTGIGLWFALPAEPGPGFYAGFVALALAALLVWRRGPETLAPLAIAVLCLALGPLAAGMRAHLQASPVLDARYYGPVTGRVVDLDRSASDALRVTLDQVVLDGMAPADTPARVRVALHGQGAPPEPGEVILVTASLAPPEGPTEPGGFDFARKAFFERLGAVGYSRTPPVLWTEVQGWDQAVGRLRADLSGAIMARIPGDPGAFASGVMTGDRSGLSLQAVQDLRDSSLAHLLAISGMNLAFLTGFVFALVRYGLALVPPLALRVNTKKLAAVAAFGVSLFYLLLSGSNVATERAFVMAAVMLGAVLFDRRALTLPSVALAAILLLLAKPESLLDPGFQMSFAATAALIAGFGMVESHVLAERLPRLAMPVFTVVLSSLIGGVATAPYAAASFNRFADYGFVANLLTVPVMGAVVMPAGAVAALLAPIGLSALPLWVMEQGCAWILFVAARIAALEGSVTMIPAPGSLVLPVLTLGGVWLVAVTGRWRAAGLIPVALALVLWSASPRPDLLVASSGGLAGLAGPDGRALSAPRGEGFAAENWLMNDGDGADQRAAAARPGFDGPRGVRAFALGEARAVVLTGKAGTAALDQACRTADLVILSDWAPKGQTGPCRLIDRAVLARTGALAFWAEGDAWRLEPARRTGRLWSPGQVPDPDLLVWRPPDLRFARDQ